MRAEEAPVRQDLVAAQPRQAPFRRIAGGAIIAVVLLVELALGAAWYELTYSATSLQRADDLSIAFTDTEREFQELQFLAATEPRFDTEAVQTRLGLLERQLSVATQWLDDPAATPQLVADIDTLVAAHQELAELARTNPTAMDQALALTASGQQAAKAAVDRTATTSRSIFLEEVRRSERTATIVAAVGAVLLVAGAVLVWAVLLRYQRSFDEAWALAAARRDALQATNEQLAALADTRERFVSVLSHELRSPLAVIGAAGETLHHHGDKLDPDTRQGILQSLRRQVARQQRMIDDLLLVAQHANSEPSPEPTDVDVAELLALVRGDEGIEGRAATFQAAPDTVARADEHHLEQVVHNLVRNAEKYGGSTIEVIAWTEGDEVVITVSDDGDGVPADRQPTLFEPFTHGHDDTQGGIGLGLAITRQLVEANGGTISYRDAPGGGAVFELRVPRAVPSRS